MRLAYGLLNRILAARLSYLEDYWTTYQYKPLSVVNSAATSIQNLTLFQAELKDAPLPEIHAGKCHVQTLGHGLEGVFQMYDAFSYVRGD